MNTELEKFEDSVKSHEDMYKSVEVIICVLDGYVIWLCAILLNKEKRRKKDETIINLNTIKVIREYWSFEELFKKLRSNEIILPSDKNSLPFIWNKIENEDKLSLSNVIPMGYRCLLYFGYSLSFRTDSVKLSWNEAEREIKERYGVNIWDLFMSKFPLLSNVGVQGPVQGGRSGFHIIAPIYTKMRRCGIEEKRNERKLKAIIESTNAKGVNIKINNLEEHSTVSLEVIPDGKLIEDTGTTKVYEYQWNIPKNCQKLEIELIDRLLPSRKEELIGFEVTNFEEKLRKFKKENLSIYYITKIPKFFEKHPFIIFSILFFFLLGLAYFSFPTYSSIVQISIAIINLMLVYIIVKNYLWDKRERDKSLAEKAIDYLVDLKGKLKECKDTVNNDIVSSDIYNLLCCHYIKPYDNLIEFFIKSEAPIIFLKLKTVLKHLNKYILELDSKTKIKAKKKIEIAIEECNYTISELRREYKLREREEKRYL